MSLDLDDLKGKDGMKSQLWPEARRRVRILKILVPVLCSQVKKIGRA